MGSRVEVRDLGWKKIRDQIKSMDGKAVTAGLHEEDAGNRDPNAVMRGYFNEFGTDTAPARPFIRTTHDTQKLKWVRQMQSDLGRVMDQQMTGQQMLESVGAMAADDIRQAVTDWDTPPNAPSTIQRKGFDDPLVETGEMRDAIAYKVRR